MGEGCSVWGWNLDLTGLGGWGVTSELRAEA